MCQKPSRTKEMLKMWNILMSNPSTLPPSTHQTEGLLKKSMNISQFQTKTGQACLGTFSNAWWTNIFIYFSLWRRQFQGLNDLIRRAHAKYVSRIWTFHLSLLQRRWQVGMLSTHHVGLLSGENSKFQLLKMRMYFSQIRWQGEQKTEVSTKLIVLS